jgi:hypothetical protein
MELQYQLKRGSYYLYDMAEPPSPSTGERRFRLKTDNVAIAFDASTGVLHKHGNPTLIQSWATLTRRRLRAEGALDSANDIVVVSGPLPVEEINKCLWIAGYCRRMFKRLSTVPHGKLGWPGTPAGKAAASAKTSAKASTASSSHATHARAYA